MPRRPLLQFHALRTQPSQHLRRQPKTDAVREASRNPNFPPNYLQEQQLSRLQMWAIAGAYTSPSTTYLIASFKKRRTTNSKYTPSGANMSVKPDVNGSNRQLLKSGMKFKNICSPRLSANFFCIAHL